jgi:hypothetical protein
MDLTSEHVTTADLFLPLTCPRLPPLNSQAQLIGGLHQRLNGRSGASAPPDASSVSFRLPPIAKIWGRPTPSKFFMAGTIEDREAVARRPAMRCQLVHFAPQPRIRSGVEFAIRALICLGLS